MNNRAYLTALWPLILLLPLALTLFTAPSTTASLTSTSTLPSAGISVIYICASAFNITLPNGMTGYCNAGAPMSYPNSTAVTFNEPNKTNTFDIVINASLGIQNQTIAFANSTTGGTPPYTTIYSVSGGSAGGYSISPTPFSMTENGITTSGTYITFTQTGMYNVTLKVTDANGNTSSSSFLINATDGSVDPYINGNQSKHSITILRGDSANITAAEFTDFSFPLEQDTSNNLDYFSWVIRFPANVTYANENSIIPDKTHPLCLPSNPSGTTAASVTCVFATNSFTQPGAYNFKANLTDTGVACTPKPACLTQLS